LETIMKVRVVALSLTLVAAPTVGTAQHTGAAGAVPSTVAPREASQFDFLLGQWELDVRPAVSSLAARIHGVPKMVGTWKAWRAFDGFGVEDELRISDESGNPRTLAHALRVYDVAARHWTNTTLDVYRATFASSAAEWISSQMTSTTRGTDKDGKAFVARSRFSDITPASFRYVQERSMDDGRTWSETLRIQAKRTAASASR
jgi:hypothetical protein